MRSCRCANALLGRSRSPSFGVTPEFSKPLCCMKLLYLLSLVCAAPAKLVFRHGAKAVTDAPKAGFGQACRRVGCSLVGDAALVQHSQARVAFSPGCAAPNDRAAIRCCGGTGGQCFSICAAENAWALSTHFRRTRQPRTCGVEPRRATHDEAVAECDAQGLRLCSEAELDSCCKTGCQADKVPVWRKCVPNECHLAVTPRNLTHSPTKQPNQAVQPSICRRQSNSMQGLSAREFYCTHGHWHHGIFCNRCDVGMQNALLRAAREAEPEDAHTVLAMGTHDGSDLEHTVNASWYDAKRTKIHGFEVEEVALVKARRKFLSHSEVQVHRAAVTDADGKSLQMSNSGQHTKVLPLLGRTNTSGYTVPTVSLHGFVSAQRIERVTYTLIDVEGNEATIVRGMRLDLPENRATFAIFQYESWNPYLNGMTQWQLAQFLEQCGYRLYAIGSRSSSEATAEPVPMHALDSSAAGAVHREVPVLLRFNSSTYMDSLWCRFSRGQRKNAPPPTPQTTSIGSNTLAVAESAIQASPWLKTFLTRHALV